MTLTAGSVKETTMNPAEIQAFRDRIGIGKLTDGRAKDGVRADWNDLPAALPSYLRRLKFSRGEIIAIESGLAEIDFDWSRDPEFLSVWVFVSGVGPQQAREKLVSLASQIMMIRIPYQSGPPHLGDLSVQHTGGQSTTIIWTFRNVCVQVDNNGTGVPVEPVARAVQAFMKAHIVSDIFIHLPKTDAVVLSPKTITVGSQVQLVVTLAKQTLPSDIVGRIRQGREHLLEEQDVQSFSATYQARQAGHSRINISLVNRKTLLSPDLGVDIAILP
jgi:hypothetical protein